MYIMIMLVSIILIFLSVTGITYFVLKRERKTGATLKPKKEEPAGRSLFYILLPFVRKIAVLNSKVTAGWFSRLRSNIQERLDKAGNPYGLGGDDFLALKEIACLAVPLAGFAVFGRANILIMVVLSIAGFFYPDLWLTDRIRRKEKMFIRELPNAIDLLTLCVEAGMDFTAGVGKVVSKSKQGYLTEELSRFLKELKIGKTRKEALEDMSKRVGIDDFVSFTAALIQADEMGTSIGRILSVQSEEIRNKLMLKIEKKAMEAPVKILLPLIGFIFPAIFIIIFGPIILKGMF